MKKLSLIVIVGGACVATSAFADTASKNSVYVSGDLGYGNLSTPDKNFADPNGSNITGASHSTGSFAGGADIGYQYAIQPSVLVGAEFGWDYNGRAKYTVDTREYTENSQDQSFTSKVISKDFHLLATGTYLFHNGLNLFAKAGGANVNQKVTFEGSGVPSNDSANQIRPMVAGGIGYQYKMVDIFAQYSHIFGQNADDFSDLLNTNATLKDVVSVDTFKLGAAVSIKI